MLHILTHNILPVFAMLALGFGMGRGRVASQEEARTINRIAFLVLQPPLLFELLTRLDLSQVRLDALAIYAACEALAFTLSYLAARHFFGRGHLESWLLGMTVVFVNSLLYVWPISILIYGEVAAQPVSAVVALDSAVTFSFFIITMELMAGDRATGTATRRLVRNPVLIAMAIAMALNLGAVPVPEPVHTAASFAGAATAPLTLFALGVILSGYPVFPSPPVMAFTALKVLAFPALVFGALALIAPDNPWADPLVLTAAGPSGAMAFSLALLYRTKTEVIAPVIVWTSLLTLVSLALLA